mgnify:CR=1 FL=1
MYMAARAEGKKLKYVATIDEDGTAKVEKFGHWLSCGRYCRIYLDGVMKKWSHWLWEEH